MDWAVVSGQGQLPFLHFEETLEKNHQAELLLYICFISLRTSATSLPAADVAKGNKPSSFSREMCYGLMPIRGTL